MAGKVLETPNIFRIFSSFTKGKTCFVQVYFSFEEQTVILKFKKFMFDSKFYCDQVNCH